MSDWKEKLNQLHKEFEGGYAEDKIVELEYALFESEKEIYNKAIDDYKAECHKQISKNHEKYGFNQRELVNLDLAEIDSIADKLKVGEEYEVD